MLLPCEWLADLHGLVKVLQSEKPCALRHADMPDLRCTALGRRPSILSKSAGVHVCAGEKKCRTMMHLGHLDQSDLHTAPVHQAMAC